MAYVLTQALRVAQGFAVQVFRITFACNAPYTLHFVKHACATKTFD